VLVHVRTYEEEKRMEEVRSTHTYVKEAKMNQKKKKKKHAHVNNVTHARLRGIVLSSRMHARSLADSIRGKGEKRSRVESIDGLEERAFTRKTPLSFFLSFVGLPSTPMKSPSI
jgi:hypothetical protein